MRVAAGIAVAGAALLFGAPAPLRAQEGLGALKARQAEAKATLSALGDREGALLAELDTLGEQVALERAAVDAAEARIREAESKIELLRAQREASARRLEALREAMAPRMVARYKLGRTGYLPMLLSSGSVDDFLRRRRLLARLVQRDLEVMAEIDALQQGLLAQAEALEEGKRELSNLRASAAERLAGLQQAQRTRQAVLLEVQSEKALHTRLVRDLARARRDLVRKMRSYEASQPAPGATGFAALRGALPMPAEGVIEASFGRRTDPRYDTVTVHKGVDIRAARGAPVRAVAEGRVVHAKWMRGYGNLVIIDHGGAYYTLMAHLGRMDVVEGQTVEPAAAVGEVGDTGSIKGAFLYFEVREGGKAVDPELWLAPR